MNSYLFLLLHLTFLLKQWEQIDYILVYDLNSYTQMIEMLDYSLFTLSDWSMRKTNRLLVSNFEDGAALQLSEVSEDQFISTQFTSQSERALQTTLLF